MSPLTTPIQHRTGNASQCGGKVRKGSKECTNWERGTKITLLSTGDMIAYVKNPKESAICIYILELISKYRKVTG